MPNYTDYIQDRLTAISLNLTVESPTRFEDLCKDLCTRKVVKELRGLIKSYIHSGSSKEGLNLLREFLANHWNQTKGTMLCYTALPNTELTSLLCFIAEVIAKENKVSPISILMPNIKVESHKPEIYPHLDDIDSLQSIVSTYICSEDGRYLIPVNLLKSFDHRVLNTDVRVNNYYYSHSDFGIFADSSGEPTDSVYITKAEVRRLYQHCHEGIRLLEAKEKYDELRNAPTDLLGQCKKILRYIDLKASLPGWATEESAVEELDVELLAFFEFFDNLSPETKAEIPADVLQETDEIKAYISSNKSINIDSDMAQRAAKLKAVIKGKEIQLSLIRLSSDAKKEKEELALNTIKELTLVCQRKTDTDLNVGRDKLPATPEMLAYINKPLIGSSYQETVENLKLVSPGVMTMFDDDSRESKFWEQFNSNDALMTLIVSIPLKNLKCLLAHINKDNLSKYLMTNQLLLLNFLELLNDERRSIICSSLDLKKKHRYRPTLFHSATQLWEDYEKTCMTLAGFPELCQAKDHLGRTPLTRLIEGNCNLFSKIILDNGTNHVSESDLELYLKHLTKSKNHNDIEKIIELSDLKNYFYTNGETLLTTAVKLEDLTLFSLLCNHGFSIDLVNKQGESPLSVALNFGHVEMVEELLSRGASFSEKDSELRLFPLILKKAWQPLTILIQSIGIENLDKTTKMKYGHYLFASNNYEEIVRAVKLGFIEDNWMSLTGRTPVATAVGQNNIELVRFLCNENFSPNKTGGFGQTPLSIAVQKGNFEMVNALVEAGASWMPFTNGVSVCRLGSFIQQNSWSVLSSIMGTVGINNISFEDRQAYQNRLFDIENYEEIDHSIKMGFLQDMCLSDGETPISAAVKRDNLRLVSFLCQHEFSVTLENKSGVPPLLLAVKRGQVEMVEHLLALGADWKTYIEGDTLLTWVLKLKNADMTKCIMRSCPQLLYQYNVEHLTGFDCLIKEYDRPLKDINLGAMIKALNTNEEINSFISAYFISINLLDIESSRKSSELGKTLQYLLDKLLNQVIHSFKRINHPSTISDSIKLLLSISENLSLEIESDLLFQLSLMIGDKSQTKHLMYIKPEMLYKPNPNGIKPSAYFGADYSFFLPDETLSTLIKKMTHKEHCIFISHYLKDISIISKDEFDMLLAPEAIDFEKLDLQLFNLIVERANIDPRLDKEVLEVFLPVLRPPSNIKSIQRLFSKLLFDSHHTLQFNLSVFSKEYISELEKVAGASFEEILLHIAGENELPDEIISQLIKLDRIDVNKTYPNDLTRLMLAVREGKTNLVDLLIKGGADPSVRNKTGQTALLFALRQGDQLLAIKLLEAGANLAGKDRYGNTAHSLIACNKLDKVKIWIEETDDKLTLETHDSSLDHKDTHSESKTKDENSRIKYASEKWYQSRDLEKGNWKTFLDSIDLISGLLFDMEEQLRPNKNAKWIQNNTKFSPAHFIECRRHIISLIKHGTRISKNALRLAIEMGETEIALCLIKAGVAINSLSSSEPSSLGLVIRRGSEGAELIVKSLVEQRCNIGAQFIGKPHQYPLKSIVRNGGDFFHELLEALLEAPGIDPDQRADSTQYTPLMLAAKEEAPELASILLEAGADPSLKLMGGETAKDIAKRYGNDEVLKVLNSFQVKNQTQMTNVAGSNETVADKISHVMGKAEKNSVVISGTNKELFKLTFFMPTKLSKKRPHKAISDKTYMEACSLTRTKYKLTFSMPSQSLNNEEKKPKVMSEKRSTGSCTLKTIRYNEV